MLVDADASPGSISASPVVDAQVSGPSERGPVAGAREGDGLAGPSPPGWALAAKGAESPLRLVVVRLVQQQLGHRNMHSVLRTPRATRQVDQRELGRDSPGVRPVRGVGSGQNRTSSSRCLPRRAASRFSSRVRGGS